MNWALLTAAWLAASVTIADGSGWSVDTDGAIPDSCDSRFVERCSDGPEGQSEDLIPEDENEDDDDDDDE